MIIETTSLILRPWNENDANELYLYAKDPAIGPIAGWPIHKSVENSREIIRNVLSEKNTFAVVLKETGKPVGSIALFQPIQSHTNIAATELEIGYWIGVPYWGQGLIPEAIRSLQKYAFTELGCTAMWCGYYDGNEKSKRVQEKCGFHYHHTETEKPCTLMGDIRTEHFTYVTKKEWETQLIIRLISEREVSTAKQLAWDVFTEYESPVYSDEGTEEFRKCLADENFLTGLEYYGAFYGEDLVGILAVRKGKCHICFFFVKGKYHRKGIGRSLFERMRQDYPTKITLNSSPYGLPFYHAIGFVPIDTEQTINGIRFTPMKYEK